MNAEGGIGGNDEPGPGGAGGDSAGGAGGASGASGDGPDGNREALLLSIDMPLVRQARDSRANK